MLFDLIVKHLTHDLLTNLQSFRSVQFTVANPTGHIRNWKACVTLARLQPFLYLIDIGDRTLRYNLSVDYQRRRGHKTILGHFFYV